MAYYEKVNCGYCGHSFTDGYQKANGLMKTYLGEPLINCPECKKDNRTGNKIWSKHKWYEKIYFWISAILRSALYGGLYISIFLKLIDYGLSELFEIELNFQTKTWIAIGAVLNILFLIFIVKVQLNFIKYLEKEFGN